MTDTEIKHTIACCNYNMADTIERSLKSMINQVRDRDDFEVLVVDDGSSDGSTKILDRLSDEYDILRVEYLDYDPNRGLGGTRNISFEEARGEYILESLDMDDIYHPGILDFVELFHQMDEQVDFDFYFQGKGITMAKKELLLEIPYRDIPRGEDKDLRRRLLANDSLVWLVHEPFRESIGYDPSFIEKRRNWFTFAVTDFRTGITFSSFLRWAVGLKSIKGAFHAITAPLAYILSLSKSHYPAAEGYEDRVKWKRDQNAIKYTLDEMESEYGVTFDQERLSEYGREIFLDDPK